MMLGPNLNPTGTWKTSVKFLKSKIADGRYWKIVKLAISAQYGSSYRNKIRKHDAQVHSESNGHMQCRA